MYVIKSLLHFLLQKKLELYDLCSLSDPTDAQVNQLALLLESMEHPSLHTSITLSDGRPATPLELVCLLNRGPKLKQRIIMLVERQKKSNHHLRQDDDSHIKNSKNFSKAQRLHGVIALFYMCGGYTHADMKDIIKLLLDHTTIDYNKAKKMISRDIFSVIIYNVQLRHHLGELEDIIKILKEYGFRMNQPKNRNEMNAIHHLVYLAASDSTINGETIVKLMKLLLDNGINVNATSDGDNALQILLWRFQNNVRYELDIIRMLIERGIDINKKNSHRENALNFLLNHRYVDEVNTADIARLLIENGANVNSRSQYGRNAVHNLLMMGFNRERIKITIRVLEMLLEAGVNVNAVDGNKRSGLFYLSWYFHMKPGSEEANITIMMAKMLIDRGINIHLRDSYGQTALDCFMSISRINAHNLEMIELLKGTSE